MYSHEQSNTTVKIKCDIGHTSSPIKPPQIVDLDQNYNGYLGKQESSDTKGCSNSVVISVHGELESRLQAIGSNIRIPHKLIDKSWVCRSKVEISVLSDLVDGLKLHVAGQFRKGAYYQAMDCLIANLRYCSQGGKDLALIYKRDTSGKTAAVHNPKKISPNVMNKCVDYLHHIGMVTAVKGTQNEYDGIASSMKVSSQLAYRLEAEKIEVALCKGAAMVKLRGFKPKTGLAKNIQLPRTRRGQLEVKNLSMPVEAYNACWINHSAYFEKDRLIPFCSRIFNNESLKLGGRFYGAEHQGLSKGERAKILIDGSNTIEPDFGALHIHLLYTMVGIQLDYVKDDEVKDPYIVKGFTRDTVKVAMLSLVNASDLSAWKRNITKSGTAKVQDAFAAWDNGELENKPKSLQGYVKGIPIGTNGAELLQAIQDKNPLIAHLFGADDLGLKLQFMDSQIMARVLVLLSGQNIPALPVHDSIRVRTIDKEAAELAMLTAYKVETGFTPSIDC